MVDGTVSGLHRSPFHGTAPSSISIGTTAPATTPSTSTGSSSPERIASTRSNIARPPTWWRRLRSMPAGRWRIAGAPVSSKIAYARLARGGARAFDLGSGRRRGTRRIRRPIAPVHSEPHRRVALPRPAHCADELEASGSTPAAAASGGPSTCCGAVDCWSLISDLYDDHEAIERELKRAARIGHEVAVFHVLSRDEIEFPFDEDVRIDDLESGASACQSGLRQRWSIGASSPASSSAGIAGVSPTASTTFV